MIRRLIFLAFTTLGYNQLPQPITNSAVFSTYNAIQENLLLCRSFSGTPGYECSLPHSALQKYYQAGQRFDLWPDADCVSACSVNIDRQGIVSIKVWTPNGLIDPGRDPKAPKAGQMSQVWFNGSVFVVM